MLVGFEFYSQQVRINGPWPVEALNVIKTNCLADYKKIYPVKNDINISLLDKIFKDSCSCRSDAIEKAKIVNVIPSAFQDDQEFKTEFAKEIMSYFASNAGQESQSKCLKKSEKINNVTTILLKPVLAELSCLDVLGRPLLILKIIKKVYRNIVIV